MREGPLSDNKCNTLSCRNWIFSLWKWVFLLQDKPCYQETKISGWFSLVFRFFFFFSYGKVPYKWKGKMFFCLECGRFLIYPHFPSYQKFTEVVTITPDKCPPENKKSNSNQKAELESFWDLKYPGFDFCYMFKIQSKRQRKYYWE